MLRCVSLSISEDVLSVCCLRVYWQSLGLFYCVLSDVLPAGGVACVSGAFTVLCWLAGGGVVVGVGRGVVINSQR